MTTTPRTRADRRPAFSRTDVVEAFGDPHPGPIRSPP